MYTAPCNTTKGFSSFAGSDDGPLAELAVCDRPEVKSSGGSWNVETARRASGAGVLDGSDAAGLESDFSFCCAMIATHEHETRMVTTINFRIFTSRDAQSQILHEEEMQWFQENE